MGLKPNLIILRGLISELRLVTTGPLNQSNIYKYIMGQFRKYQTTDEQLCKQREEMKYMASIYLSYLKSTRLQKQINAEFHMKGERSVADTAKMVGFKLPHDPK